MVGYLQFLDSSRLKCPKYQIKIRETMEMSFMFILLSNKALVFLVIFTQGLVEKQKEKPTVLYDRFPDVCLIKYAITSKYEFNRNLI